MCSAHGNAGKKCVECREERLFLEVTGGDERRGKEWRGLGRVENVEVEREETDNLWVVVKGNYIERGEGEDLEFGNVSPIFHVILI